MHLFELGNPFLVFKDCLEILLCLQLCLLTLNLGPLCPFECLLQFLLALVDQSLVYHSVLLLHLLLPKRHLLLLKLYNLAFLAGD